MEFSRDNSKSELLKRSISNSSFEQGLNKESKSTLITSSQISNEYPISKIIISSDLIWDEDERFSKIYYYNRIDDTDFDKTIFASCLLERIIDIVTTGKPKFTLEHYFHLKKKKQQVENNMRLCTEMSEQLNSLNKDNEENKNDFIFNEMHKQTATRRLEDQLQIKKISEEDFKSFSDFLDEIYQKFELID